MADARPKAVAWRNGPEAVAWGGGESSPRGGGRVHLEPLSWVVAVERSNQL